MENDMETNKIYQGNALKVLKTLSDESINCVMTSPPYWALRDYGSSVESIWDEIGLCEHEFKIIEEKNPMDRGGYSQHDSGGLVGKMKENTQTKVQQGFCSKCGAWKGQLGLEPTFDLYIKHLCDIFDEVKRVLRKDGTCWINLGDTYCSQPAGNTEESKGDFWKKRNNIRESDMAMQKVDRANIDGVEQKGLILIPFRFAIEMQNRGWILRNVIIWHKPNCMPCSVKDRFTVDFEYLFFFVRSKKYWFETQREPHSEESINDLINRGKNKRVDINYLMKTGSRKMGIGFGKGEHGSKNLGTGMDADKKGRDRLEFYHPDGRNKRTVWSICPKPFKESHFAVYPEELCETPIKAGCPELGVVLDMFFGAGTTGLVALKQNKKFIGIELNPEYIKIAKERLKPFLEQTKL